MDLTNKWLIATYGCIGWNLLIWYILKQQADKKNQDFNWPLFRKQYIDDWLVTIFFIPLIVTNGKDIHALNMVILKYIADNTIGKDLTFKWYDIFYASVGPFVAVIYFILTSLIPVIKTKIQLLITKWFDKKLGE